MVMVDLTVMMRKMRTLSGILLGGFNRGCICNLAGADEGLMDMREAVMFVWSTLPFAFGTACGQMDICTAGWTCQIG